MQESQHKSTSGLVRIWRAAGYSMHGLSAAFKHEHAFRQELVLACILIPLTFVMPVEKWWRALMISSVLLVLIVELINSAVEATVDRISLDDHQLAKRAKDIGSAAVLLSIVNVIVIWAMALI